MNRPTHVNLITGFLGSGKTSTLLHLLGQRPPARRWAVLVNEFGALGIDGTVIGDRQPGEVRVSEIAGGCLCCAAGASFRVALTRLLREHRPERLLIEATGLGHAGGIVDVLREPELMPYLHLDSILCLVDPREFSDERLHASAIYAGQLQLADVLVLNKADLATETQLRKVEEWAAETFPPRQAVVRARHGNIDAALLELPRGDGIGGARFCPRDDESHAALSLRFPVETVFPRPALRTLLEELRVSDGVLRIKGIMRTGREWSLIDATPDALSLSSFSHRRDSLLELIHDTRFPSGKKALRARFEALAQKKRVAMG